jgi:SAM-dependent methyltransferase
MQTPWTARHVPRSRPPGNWSCPVCGGVDGRDRWAVPEAATEGGVDAASFRPSSDRFGAVAATVICCGDCGHGSLAHLPDAVSMSGAYEGAVDPVSLREERGQVETATRALRIIERFVSPAAMLDVGCWTGSFLVAARDRGWSVSGIEPSRWAAARAEARGVDVVESELGAADRSSDRYQAIVMCDVLEHLGDPGTALEVVRSMLDPHGVLYLTVPDAGSIAARVMGRRWWSVLPMHVQYFTRASMGRLLVERGFAVRHVRSHAKVFTAGYYAERLGGYGPRLERPVEAALRALRVEGRLVAPNFFDRMEVIASR